MAICTIGTTLYIDLGNRVPSCAVRGALELHCYPHMDTDVRIDDPHHRRCRLGSEARRCNAGGLFSVPRYPPDLGPDLRLTLS